MKSIILIVGLLAIVSCGKYEEKCNNSPACQECAISWYCEYGNEGQLKEDCYKDCVEHSIDYDTHASVQEGEEVTVHKKVEEPALVQVKLDNPEKEKCSRNQACEACAISWQCEYGSKPELVENCYKVCYEHKIDFDQHTSVTEAEEVNAH